MLWVVARVRTRMVWMGRGIGGRRGYLVNFRKRQKASEVIQDIQHWQTLPHHFHPAFGSSDLH